MSEQREDQTRRNRDYLFTSLNSWCTISKCTKFFASLYQLLQIFRGWELFEYSCQFAH